MRRCTIKVAEGGQRLSRLHPDPEVVGPAAQIHRDTLRGACTVVTLAGSRRFSLVALDAVGSSVALASALGFGGNQCVRYARSMFGLPDLENRSRRRSLVQLT